MINSSIKFIQLSDTHISKQGSMLHSNNPREKLKACLDEIKKNHSDAAFLCITGDVTNDDEPECFLYLQELLSDLHMPWFITLGNHDSRQALLRAIPEYPQDPNGFIQFKLETNAGSCIILDTIKDGQSSGILCEKRLDWLSEQLEKTSPEPVLLFFHHPPTTLGIPSMDAIVRSLENPEQLYDVLKPHKETIKHIFTGHVHRPICGSWHGIPFSCIPSTTHQIALTFQPEEGILGFKKPSGYGIIFVDENQLVVHFQEYGKIPDIVIKK